MYAICDDGTRASLPHPSTKRMAFEATGKEIDELWELGRIGRDEYFFCLSCGEGSCLDPKHDKLKCPECGDDNICNHEEVVGKTCPKCKEGQLTKDYVGIS